MKKIITTPISYDDIKDLRIGDVVYLTGTVSTCRDAGHERYLDGAPLQTDLKDGAIFHAGPIVKATANGYEIVAIGPTTSMRMEKMEAEFIKRSGVRIIIGKGGMGTDTAEACVKYGCIHCVFPGGCAIVAADAVKKVTAVEWEDLGMPEAFWVTECERLGPLIVSIDVCGNNLFEAHKKEISDSLPKIKLDLHQKIDDILKELHPR